MKTAVAVILFASSFFCGECTVVSYEHYENKYCIWPPGKRGDFYDSLAAAEKGCTSSSQCTMFYESEEKGTVSFYTCPLGSTINSRDGSTLYTTKEGCKDQLPVGYGCTSTGHWGCQDMAQYGLCNMDWSQIGCGNANGLIKNDCKMSCNNCDSEVCPSKTVYRVDHYCEGDRLKDADGSLEACIQSNIQKGNHYVVWNNEKCWGAKMPGCSGTRPLTVGRGIIYDVSSCIGCTCHSDKFVDKYKLGNCKNPIGKEIGCYVSEPSGCKDLFPAQDGRPYSSSQACRSAE